MNELQKFWHKNGKREMELNYQNGFKHGKQEGWYNNGNPKFSSSYFLGKKDGIQETWKTDGTLDREKLYKSCKLIRISKGWFKFPVYLNVNAGITQLNLSRFTSTFQLLIY